MKEQKSVNNIQFISLDDYALLNSEAVSYVHSKDKQFYYSYISEDIQNPAVLYEGDKRKEYVVCVKNAACFPESDVILLDSQHAYHEFKNISCLQGIADCRDDIILVKDTQEEYEIRIPEDEVNIPKGVFLSGLFSRNYYHFVYSIIAKTELLKFVPKDVPLLVDNTIKEFESYNRLLEICNTDGREIIFLEPNVCSRVASLYLISLPSFLAPNVYFGAVDKPQYTQYDIENLRQFRNRVLASVEKKSDLPKRIFLSRKNASSRRPFNEYECQNFLKNYGFETICPEDFSFEQQVQLFHNAEMIAGGSGAAFTNLLYCSEKCRIILFIGYKISLSLWQPLVCLNDARIYRIHDREKGELTQENHPHDIHNPFYIDTDDIENLMSQLGIQKETIFQDSLSEEETVTVSILTYNSSKTVLQTLDSIKAQTYPYLNLNICDDCSTDDTISVCEKWVKDNRDRFQNVKIAGSFRNYGVAINGNRSLYLCETRYLKEIAGDDFLEKNCISRFVQYAKSNPTPAIYFSRIKFYLDNPDVPKWTMDVFDYNFFKLNPQSQLDFLILKHNVVPAASAFYNVEKLRHMKLRNDERIPALEDWPKWINYLRKGGTFGFIDEELADYRVGNGVSTRADLKAKYLFSNLKFELLYRATTVITQDEKTFDNYAKKVFANLFMGNQVKELHELKTILQNQVNTLQNQVNTLQNQMNTLHIKHRKHLKIMQKLIMLSVGLLLVVLYFIIPSLLSIKFR